MAVALLDHVTYPYHADEDAEADAEEECSICLGPFEQDELCSIMPVCRHEFHKPCIAGWAQLQWFTVAENMV
nr:unnamed protein product [Digitaria exilis]